MTKSDSSDDGSNGIEDDLIAGSRTHSAGSGSEVVKKNEHEQIEDLQRLILFHPAREGSHYGKHEKNGHDGDETEEERIKGR